MSSFFPARASTSLPALADRLFSQNFLDKKKLPKGSSIIQN
jgi:hypothetical protein